MTEIGFEVDIDADAGRKFAEISGDWNPIHTDPGAAAASEFGRPVLHGAYAAGLLSRLAGMYLPGPGALLHTMRLRFVAPMLPPLKVRVVGRLVAHSSTSGSVEAEIVDVATGRRLIEGGYDFGRHRADMAPAARGQPIAATGGDVSLGGAPILVTGGSGGLGRAVLAALGARGITLGREVLEGDGAAVEMGPIAGIVHCAWPGPDDIALTSLRNPAEAIDRHVAAPLRHIQLLGTLLRRRGAPGATLILVGSTAGEPGRHAWRGPLYSLAKGMVPTLTRILAVELGRVGMRCVSASFDVIDGGINRAMSEITRRTAADRAPDGQLPTMEQAAAELVWILGNAGRLVSGATISLTGGALP